MNGRESLPVIDVTDLPAAAEPRTADVHGVVLAAGTSSRYGERNKLLETLDGETLVYRATSTLLASDVTGVTVIVGHQADWVRDAVADLDVEIRTNTEFDAGQSTSVATGVEAARDNGADAVLVALGDMPNVSVETVNTLVSAYERGAGDALAAAYEGARGNPVLFDGRYFDDLINVEGDVGGRDILLTDPDSAAIETGDPGVLYDIDRSSDR